MPLRSAHWLRAAVLLVSGLAAGPLVAQTDWPGRPVRIIVTFSAGGAADFTARVVGERLSDLWKQPVVVENRIGAGGNIGVEAVQRSTPDGHTLLLASSAQPINVALYSKLPFDLFRDFASIALVTVSPMALAVNPRVKASTLREYTELVRASPGKMSYATCGVATSHHFAFELYKFEAKLSALHIPYRGCAAAVSDAAGGQIDTVMSSLNTLLPHQATGRLRVLAITARNRSASSPEIPTFRESGVPELKGYESSVYYGFMAPAATPRTVIGRIESDLRAVMGQPEVGKRLATAGMEVAFVPGKEMAAILRSDADQIRRIVEFAGIKPE
ncbi:MAG: Bug family tripartite tricarboxylate transporter substrate binding protein [Pseudomonadota bacterium]|jgi:tripartite-type tricarboxylate transporter receptor subunit TctC